MEATCAVRGTIRMAILKGEIEEALAIIAREFPAVVASSSWQGSLACTLLLSQQLVELVREKKTPEAVDWLRSQLAPLRDQIIFEAASAALRTAVMLVAYKDGPDDPKLPAAARAQFSIARRQLTAETVNEALVRGLADGDQPSVNGHGANGEEAKAAPLWTPVNAALRHLVSCRRALLQRNKGRGVPVHAHPLCYASAYWGGARIGDRKASPKPATDSTAPPFAPPPRAPPGARADDG